MRAVLFTAVFYFASTCLVESLFLGGLLGFKAGLLAGAALGGSRRSSRGHSSHRSSYRPSRRRTYSSRRYVSKPKRTYSRKSYHSHSYHKRDVSDVTQQYDQMYNTNMDMMESNVMKMISQASYEDVDDCAKSFVCQVAAKPEAQLDDLESYVREMFFGEESEEEGNQSSTPTTETSLGCLDTTKPSTLFDLAALVGRTAGEQQCRQLYARCPLRYEELKDIMEDNVHFQEPLVQDDAASMVEQED